MARQHSAMQLLGLSPRRSGEVLAIVSHDLRIPLSTISLGTSLLADASQPEKERTQVLEIIKRAAGRMERLIKDLQELGRLDAGRILRIDARPNEGLYVIDTKEQRAPTIELFRRRARSRA